MIQYFFKYYIYNGSNKLLRSSFVLPFLTIFIGCFVIMFSFSVMQGFSTKISNTIYFFDKEYSLVINKKDFLNNYTQKDLDSLFSFLIEKKYFFNAYEDRVMFVGSDNNKTFSRVYGIKDFDDFKPNQFLLYDSSLDTNYISGCYLGYNQSMNLNIDYQDIIKVSSVLDFKNLNSFPQKNFNVKNIIKTNIPRYDNSIFVPFDSIIFSKNIFLKNNLKNKISDTDLILMNSNFGQGIIYDENIQLFGFFIVFISAVMLMGFNVSSIIRNISKIGLLESLGFKRLYIALFYLFYGIFIAMLGFFCSFIAFQFLLFLDNNYQILDFIFNPNIYFDFSLELSSHVLLKIFILVLVIIILSTLYPFYKISKLDIVDSIRNRV